MNHLQQHSLQLLGRKKILTRPTRRIIAARRRVEIRAGKLAGFSQQD